MSNREKINLPHKEAIYKVQLKLPSNIRTIHYSTLK